MDMLRQFSLNFFSNLLEYIGGRDELGGKRNLSFIGNGITTSEPIDLSIEQIKISIMLYLAGESSGITFPINYSFTNQIQNTP